ncbi:hypothetical protein CAEBREN_20312 [Caenorhabditis brenneri]|uniref:Sdz-33 F-box domain-containing protein n=1 Tax=Caenorhabditis brenneri TaxID=135651 RepID=G0NDT4_CAEBE|nr:hypothetical protein CAEBREN_20312 [Caenorhabditis brenneri]
MSLPEFPFQFLPSLTKEKVVQVMGGQDRLSFSTISEDANKLSKPRKQQAKIVTIGFNGEMKLKSDIKQFPTLTIKLAGDVNFTPRQVYSTCQYIDGVKQDWKIRKMLKRSRYSLRDWIDHYIELVKCDTIMLELEGFGLITWNPATLLKVFQGLNVEQIELFGQVGEHGIRVVQQCPTVKRAYFGDYFPTGNERVELLSREFDEFGTTSSPDSKLALPEILLLRSRVVVLLSTWLDQHSLNSLLKEWENGWNPNFEVMLFQCYSTIGNIPDILDGIDYHEVVDDDKDLHRFIVGPALLWIDSDEWSEKAYQIQRKETGVKANLNFATFSTKHLTVKLIVQH